MAEETPKRNSGISSWVNGFNMFGSSSKPESTEQPEEEIVNAFSQPHETRAVSPSSDARPSSESPKGDEYDDAYTHASGVHGHDEAKEEEPDYDNEADTDDEVPLPGLGNPLPEPWWYGQNSPVSREDFEKYQKLVEAEWERAHEQRRSLVSMYRKEKRANKKRFMNMWNAAAVKMKKKSDQSWREFYQGLRLESRFTEPIWPPPLIEEENAAEPKKKEKKLKVNDGRRVSFLEPGNALDPSEDEQNNGKGREPAAGAKGRSKEKKHKGQYKDIGKESERVQKEKLQKEDGKDAEVPDSKPKDDGPEDEKAKTPPPPKKQPTKFIYNNLTDAVAENSIRILLLRVRVALYDDQFDRAWTLVREAMMKARAFGYSPMVAKARFWRGMVYHHKGNVVAASRDFKLCKAIRGHFIEADQLDDILEYYEDVIRMNPAPDVHRSPVFTRAKPVNEKSPSPIPGIPLSGPNPSSSSPTEEHRLGLPQSLRPSPVTTSCTTEVEDPGRTPRPTAAYPIVPPPLGEDDLPGPPADLRSSFTAPSPTDPFPLGHKFNRTSTASSFSDMPDDDDREYEKKDPFDNKRESMPDAPENLGGMIGNRFSRGSIVESIEGNDQGWEEFDVGGGSRPGSAGGRLGSAGTGLGLSGRLGSTGSAFVRPRSAGGRTADVGGGSSPNNIPSPLRRRQSAFDQGDDDKRAKGVKTGDGSGKEGHREKGGDNADDDDVD